MLRNLSLFITTRTDRDVAHYECGEERSCISTSGDHRRSVVGASGSESGASGRGRSRSRKDLDEIEILEWWKVALD